MSCILTTEQTSRVYLNMIVTFLKNTCQRDPRKDFLKKWSPVNSSIAIFLGTFLTLIKNLTVKKFVLVSAVTGLLKTHSKNQKLCFD